MEIAESTKARIVQDFNFFMICSVHIHTVQCVDIIISSGYIVYFIFVITYLISACICVTVFRAVITGGFVAQFYIFGISFFRVIDILSDIHVHAVGGYKI